MSRSVDAWRRALLFLVLAALVPALRAAPLSPGVKRHYRVVAGDAATTLRQFVEQSGEQVIYVVPKVRGVKTNPVEGEFTAREVLERMVAQTDLTVVQDEKTGAFTIKRVVPPPPVSPKQTDTPTPKNQDRMKSNTLLARLGAMFALATVPTGAAETAPPASDKSSEAVVLTPFEVRTDRDEGYLANNTLSGTRLNTALKDTPASINIFTEEFMKDIGAFNLNDVMQYGLNLQFDRDDAGGFGDSPNGNGTVSSLQGYRVRGVNVSIARNYFTSGDGGRDTFNIERIEQSRGPNSVLFGIGSAGGVINQSTKQGIIGRSFQKVLLSAGSYQSWRSALDVNQSVGRKAAVRVNLVKYRSGTYRLFQDSEGYGTHVAVKYRVLPKVEVRAEVERQRFRDNSPRNNVLFDFNSYWIAAGRPLLGPTDAIPTGNGAAIGSRLAATTSGSTLRFIQNPGQSSAQLITMAGQVVTNGDNIPVLDDRLVVPQINTQGPTADRINDFKSRSVFVNAQLAKNLFFEAGYNHEDVDRPHNWNATQSERFRADANTTLPGTLGANPYAGSYFTEASWQQYAFFSRADRGRVSLSFEQDAGRWGFYRAAVLGEMEQKWAMTPTYIEVYSGHPFNSTPENAANQVIRRAYFTTGKWDTYYETGPGAGLIRNQVDPISGRTLSSEMVLFAAPPDVRYLQKGALAALQATYFKGRLVVGTGLRKDWREDFTRAYTRDPVTNVLVQDPGKGTRTNLAGRTYTLGTVAHVTKNFDLIYNRSDNFNLPTAGQLVMTGDPSGSVKPPPNPAGKGEEYGVAVTLLDGRVYARAVHYETNTVDIFGFQGSNAVGPTARQILNQLRAATLITQADVDAHASNSTGSLSDRDADGYEFSVTGNPTRNLRLMGSFAISNSTISNARKTDFAYWDAFKKYVGQFPDRVGLGSATTTMAQEISETEAELDDARVQSSLGQVGNRKYMGKFFGRYTFSQGFLRDLWIGGGYDWKSRMLMGRNTTRPASNPSGQLLWSAPIGEANAAAGYSLKLRDRHRINLTLNVRNLFDETEPIITRRFNDSSEAVRRILYRSPRTWQLTADYEF